MRQGKHGRWAAGRIPVFGLLKRGGHVFVMPVKDTKSDTLIPTGACKVQPDSAVYTDSFRAFDQLEFNDFLDMRINHSKLFADRENHINGIENFIPRRHFLLLIKECEWRFKFGPAGALLQTLINRIKLYSQT